MKKAFYIGVGLIGVFLLALLGRPVEMPLDQPDIMVEEAVVDLGVVAEKPVEEVTKKPVEPTYFAEVDKDGTVKRVIVADQAFIVSGAVGDPANWVETKYDGTEPTAVIGGKFDKIESVFKTKEEVRGDAKQVIEAVIATST